MMSNNSLRDFCYTLYKMDWMRRISADRQIDAYTNWYEEEYLPNYQEILNAYSGDLDTVYTGVSFGDWIEDVGYDGEIYASEIEFFNNEFFDKMYMKSLLDDEKLYTEYLKEVEA